MRTLAMGVLTFLLVIQTSALNAQGYNMPVLPAHPEKPRHVCSGAGYYDNVQTCCCINNSTGQYCLRQSGGQSCDAACRSSFPC